MILDHLPQSDSKYELAELLDCLQWLEHADQDLATAGDGERAEALMDHAIAIESVLASFRRYEAACCHSSRNAVVGAEEAN